MLSARRPYFFALLLFVLVVLPLGILEGWYGRIDYSGDAIPYLDMARAVHTADWKLVFNPLWGLGYALLIAALQPLFAATPAGEWNLVHVLNLLIYTAAYASFLFLLRSMVRTRLPGANISPSAKAKLVLAGTALFLPFELCVDTVSRVGPDLLVTTLILLALALLLRLLAAPRADTALLLGLTLAAGYITKTIFLPLSLVILLTALLGLRWRRQRPALLALTAAVALVVSTPYAIGLSRAFGHFTLGESGTLNYAWHVNRLMLLHWQGGPSRFGTPLHPTTQLIADQPVYGFAEPFHVSYPPFFNPPYYYQGYHHFFSLRLQLRAIAASLLHLFQALVSLPAAYAILACLVVIFSFRQPRRSWLLAIRNAWPILLPALAGIALYLQVHLEARYLPGFLLVLAAVPLTFFLLQSAHWPRWVATLTLCTLWLGAFATFSVTDRNVLAAARHHARYTDGQQWILARYLLDHGAKPGDEVAVIGGPANHCTWAHVDHLRIVAELSADLYAPPSTGPDLFWHATPIAREQILHAFARTGARMVIAAAPPQQVPGWTSVPGTNVAVHTIDLGVTTEYASTKK